MQDADDEQVNTSDAEEYEELQAGSSSYWSTHIPGIRTRFAVFNGRDSIFVPEALDHSRRAALTTPRRVTDEHSRPRKRLKIDVTPSSSISPDGDGEDCTLPPISSQATVSQDGVPSSRLLRSGPSTCEELSSMRADSEDPLDLFPNASSYIGPQMSPYLSPSRVFSTVMPLSISRSQPIQVDLRGPPTPIPLSSVDSSPLSSPPSSPIRPSEPDNLIHRVEDTGANQATGRWSFRSRNVYQMHPYLFDKAQYRRQMRDLPDAIVQFRSPRRRRRGSIGLDLDDEFIAQEGSQMTQSVLNDLNGRSRTPPHKPRRDHPNKNRDSTEQVASSSRTSAATASTSANTGRDTVRIPGSRPIDDTNDSPVQKWYPKFMQQGISDSETSENEAMPQSPKASTRPTRPEKPISNANLSKTSDNEQLNLSPLQRRRRRPRPKPPPWARHSNVAEPIGIESTDKESSIFLRGGSNQPIELNDSVDSVPSNNHWEPDIQINSDHESSSSSRSSSRDSSPSETLSTPDRKRLRVLMRMMPRGMALKQLNIYQQSSRRSTTAPLVDRTSSPPNVLPGQTKTRIATDSAKRDVPLILGDAESSDSGDSVIEISSSERSISDVEELRTQGYPGVLDIPLFSASEDEETDVEMEVVKDADIGAWLQRKPRRRKSAQDSLEATEGDLIDRMLSRTRMPRSKKNAGSGSRQARGRLKKNGLHIAVRGVHSHKRQRQMRLTEHFKNSNAQEGNGSRHARGDGSASMRKESREGHEIFAIQPKTKPRKPQPRSLLVLPAKRHITSGRRHKDGMTLDLEEVSPSVPFDLFRPGFNQVDSAPKHRPCPVVESTEYRATHPTEFFLLPSEVSFGEDTYLGKSWLNDFIVVLRSRSSPVPEPYSADNIELSLETDINEFSNTLQSVFDHLLQDVSITGWWDKAKYNKWQDTLHAICQFLTWMSAGTFDLVVSLRNQAKDQVKRLVERLDERLNSSILNKFDDSFLLSLYWFALELSLRSSRAPQEGITTLFELGTALVKHLLHRGFLYPASSVFPDPGIIAELTPFQRMYQIWISLYHLADGLSDWFEEHPTRSSLKVHGIWQLVQSAYEQQQLSDLEASEQLWSAMFNICAVSQFSILGLSSSTPRLLAAWEMSCLAIRRIRLSADPSVDGVLPRRRLVKRDRYIRLIISRCFFLRQRWSWDLKDDSTIFNVLVEVFKSRKYANLYGEPSDFPSFMRHNDVSLLSEYRHSDTAFGLFLKLAAKSVHDIKEVLGEAASNGISLKLRKLMSMLIPVGSVSFNKNTTLSAQDLSMYYNRLSAVAVAIYLDPIPANVNNRLAQARRYITFKDSELSTRRACIRGMMHFAMIMQSLHLPLTSVFEWVNNITNILLDEYQSLGSNSDASKDPRNRVIIALQLLLGSLRRIIESAQKSDSKSYPDPAFLEGPWISRVFSSTTDIVNLSTTGFEMHRFVQTFLDSRAAVMPKPRRPQVHNLAEENEDSQDLYGQMDIDLDDPELLAALGGESEAPELKEMQEKDRLVSDVMDKHVSPGIYRLVFKHVSDVPEGSALEDTCVDIDTWIDCWVGCAQVVVYNGKRDWSFYLSLGSQSWERIIEGSWRRRVGLRFMYMLLRLDPASYLSHKDIFFDVLLESLVTRTITMEHEYASLLFSVDGLQHPLLRNIDYPKGANGDYIITYHSFSQARIQILSTIFTNLSTNLQNEQHTPDLRGTNQISLGHIVKMLVAMQDIYQSLQSSPTPHEYRTFLSTITKMLTNQHPLLSDHERLKRFIIINPLS